MKPLGKPHRWINYAACVWAVLFAAPHIWWALGISFGFPGGAASYRFFMSSTWRYVYDLVVVLLSALAVFIALTLSRSPRRGFGRWLLHTLAWIACGMLTLRGVAGFIHDGLSDLIWNPTFFIGGILFGGVAWLAHKVPPSTGASGRSYRSGDDSPTGSATPMRGKSMTCRQALY